MTSPKPKLAFAAKTVKSTVIGPCLSQASTPKQPLNCLTRHRKRTSPRWRSTSAKCKNRKLQMNSTISNVSKHRQEIHLPTLSVPTDLNSPLVWSLKAAKMSWNNESLAQIQQNAGSQMSFYATNWRARFQRCLPRRQTKQIGGPLFHKVYRFKKGRWLKC